MRASARESNPASFSVIVVNYNGGSMLASCVESVLHAGVPAGQIVVVDNGSTDSSLDGVSVKASGLSIIRMGCNAGFACAVNQGLRTVQTQYALLLNNDATLSRSVLGAFANSFSELPLAAILGARLLHADGTLQNSVAPFPRLVGEILPRPWHRLARWGKLGGRPTGTERLMVESVIGACIAVRMSAAAEIGMLDEDFFFYLEETEWCHRAWRKGWQVWHVPSAAVEHLQGKTANSFRTGARIEFQRSKLTYYRKVGGTERWFAALSILVIKAGINAIVNLAATILTFFLSPKLRQRSSGYLTILAWYIRGMPATWGLPEKCQNVITTKKAS